MEAKTAEALRRSIRQPGVGFREDMLQALEGASVFTLCDAPNGVDTITHITGIGKRARWIVESWAGRVARELGFTVNELKVEAEKMKIDENDTTSENRSPTRVSAVPTELRDKPLRFDTPKLASDKIATSRVRNALRKNTPKTDSEGRVIPFNEIQVTLGSVEAILRSPSSKHEHMRPQGSNWRLAEACLEDTLRQHGYELAWGGVLDDEEMAEQPKLTAQAPADVPTPLTLDVAKPRAADRRGAGRNRSRGVMGDIERHLREAGSPRTLDEMTDVIRQSVLTRLQEGKNVFAETAGQWGLVDWSRPHNTGKTVVEDAVSHPWADIAGAKLRERHGWMLEGIITEADYESYKKRVLET